MDEKILMEIGKKKGLINKEHIEKDYFQDVLLYNLFRKINKLVFKGGTALYKIYKMPRFSEYLDFTMLENFGTEQLKQIVEGITKSMKWEIKSVRETKDSLLIKIGFNGIITEYNTLRIDVSIKNKVLEGFEVKNYVPEFIDINPFSLRVLKLEEMVAEKIHSILTREKARDMYDLFFLLRISRFNKELVDKKLAIFKMNYNFNRFKKTVNNLEILWGKELKPFVLTELVDFKTVKDFVLDRVK